MGGFHEQVASVGRGLDADVNPCVADEPRGPIDGHDRDAAGGEVLEEILVGGTRQEILVGAVRRCAPGRFLNHGPRRRRGRLGLRASVSRDGLASEPRVVDPPARRTDGRVDWRGIDLSRRAGRDVGHPQAHHAVRRHRERDALRVIRPLWDANARAGRRVDPPLARPILRGGDRAQPQPGAGHLARLSASARIDPQPREPQLRLRQLRDRRQTGPLGEEQPRPVGAHEDRRRLRRVEDVGDRGWRLTVAAL